MFHRARSGAGRGVILIRLNTTSSSSPVKEVSFFDKAKKWTKITSPLLTFGVVSSFVIGNLAIRHYTEAVFPAYVQFLRDNYGFEDEDDEERSRVAAIEANNSKRKWLLSICLFNVICLIKLHALFIYIPQLCVPV